MALASSPTPGSPHSDRRTFLWSLASVGLIGTNPHQHAETVYRFFTPECEVEMNVEYFKKSTTSSFRFRDGLTNRALCFSADGEENRTCVQRFTGSIAIAHYRFRSRPPAKLPVSLKERVLTIDRDSRMNPRPPFERVLPLDREVVSDIQAFGYNPDDPKQGTNVPQDLWCLLRQDLYFNDQEAAFLVVHWKHTLDSISLVDVIPGDRTQSLAE
jgi:hypothetical protein